MRTSSSARIVRVCAHLRSSADRTGCAPTGTADAASAITIISNIALAVAARCGVATCVPGAVPTGEGGRDIGGDNTPARGVFSCHAHQHGRPVVRPHYGTRDPK